MGESVPLAWGTTATRMHYGEKKASRQRQCDALGNVQLRNLGSYHPCECYFDMHQLHRHCCRHPFMEMVFHDGCVLFQTKKDKNKNPTEMLRVIKNLTGTGGIKAQQKFKFFIVPHLLPVLLLGNLSRMKDKLIYQFHYNMVKLLINEQCKPSLDCVQHVQ